VFRERDKRFCIELDLALEVNDQSHRGFQVSFRPSELRMP
jgi:hypothetical protein